MGPRPPASRDPVLTLRWPPGAYPGPRPFPGDRPGASQSYPLWFRSALGPLCVTLVPPKDLSKCSRSACSKPWKYVYLASPNFKKSLSSCFLDLPDPLRMRQTPRPFLLGSAQVAQKASQDRPGTPKKVPRPARASPRASVLIKTVFYIQFPHA